MWPLVTADWNFWPNRLAPEEIFAIVRRLGFDGIELGIYDAASLQAQAGEIERLQQAHRLPVAVILYSLPPDRWRDGCLASTDAAARRRVMDEAIRIAGLGRRLGASLLGIWLGGDRVAGVADYRSAWAGLCGGVREVAGELASMGITLALEYKPGEVVGNADAFLRLAEAVAAPNLRLLLDTGHALYGREDLVSVVRMCGPLLTHVHLNDNYGDYDRDLPPGEVHNFAPFFAALRQAGYRGALGLDLYVSIVEEGRRGEEACRASKAYIESTLRALGGPADG